MVGYIAALCQDSVDASGVQRLWQLMQLNSACSFVAKEMSIPPPNRKLSVTQKRQTLKDKTNQTVNPHPKLSSWVLFF